MPCSTACESAGDVLTFVVYFADYVFVDEHNRHKRLKGMDFFLMLPQSF